MAYEATIRGIGVGVGAGGAESPAVLLEARGELVPIFIDPGQAQAIEHGRQGIPADRPLTHDLFVDVLEDLGETLDRVRIDAIEGGTFYAKLDFSVERGNEQESIVHDARPSDGIALAVRVDCPITIADAVIDEAGRNPDRLGVGPVERGAGSPVGPGMDVEFGSDPTDTGTSEEHEPIDLDEGVDIEIEEPDVADDDESES